MNVNASSVFEGAVSEVLIQHADIPDFPRIRTWRSVDAEGRWSPVEDRAFPVVTVSAGVPEDDDQNEDQVILAVGVHTNAEDDATHRRVSDIEASVRSALTRLAREYHAGTGPVKATFDASIQAAIAGSGIGLLVGGVYADGGDQPLVIDGVNEARMQVRIKYLEQAL